MNRRTLIAGAVVAIAIIVFVMVVGLLRFNFTEVLPSWLWVRRGPELVVNGSFEDGNHEDDPTHGEPFVQFGKVLCAGSSALTSWQVFRQSKPMDCLAGADAVFWQIRFEASSRGVANRVVGAEAASRVRQDRELFEIQIVEYVAAFLVHQPFAPHGDGHHLAA